MSKYGVKELTLLIAVFGALALASCGGDGSTASTPASPGSSGVAVTIKSFAYEPPTLIIAAGTTVTWTNEDTAAHTVTSADGPSTSAGTTDLFDSGMMAKGDAFSYTFAEAGTYDYLCTPHRSMPRMHARVVVE